MKRITTIIARTFAAACIRRSWNTMRAAERALARGERMEAWANRLAVRWSCVDDVIATVTSQALSSR
jgi:hypothetical protein